MRKENRQYYFLVEGETERLYLKWLSKTINNDPNSLYHVSFNCTVGKSPISHSKKMANLKKSKVIHIFDYESNQHDHQSNFRSMMDEMKVAGSDKSIEYIMGYSNFTFELWMILHKMDCFASFNMRDHYLNKINEAYNMRFNGLREYKSENNFNSLLNSLSITDVITAIERSDKIMKVNAERGYVLEKYKGYCYYRENPSLTIDKAIKDILEECGLMG